MLALVNGRLIDGTGHEPVEKATIVVDGNRIKNVGPKVGLGLEHIIADIWDR